MMARLAPMARLLEALGFDVNKRTRRCACLLYGGSNPSAFSWAESGIWYCYSCGAGGNRIALVRAVRRCHSRGALEFLALLADVTLGRRRASREEIALIQADREREGRVMPLDSIKWAPVVLRATGERISLGARCVQEWRLTLAEHVRSPPYRLHRTVRSAKHQALDIPPGRAGLYSAWTPRCFHPPHPRQHGRAGDYFGGTKCESVALLCPYGDSGLRDRRLCHLPAGPQGWKGNACAQVFPQDAEESLCHIRTMGIRLNRPSCHVAASGAHGSIFACRGRDAIFVAQIPGGTHIRQADPIYGPVVPRSPLWAHDAGLRHAARASWLAGRPWRDCHRRYGLRGLVLR
jgi:hypothetical protein